MKAWVKQAGVIFICGFHNFSGLDIKSAMRESSRPAAPPYFEPRNVAWTYFYGADDTYSRIDYILLSPALARNRVKAETYIPAIPNWGIASDHRPIVATFEEK
jgi:endonuclease/exonuclease/phosphatase family metal-dependent hydrolase